MWSLFAKYLNTFTRRWSCQYLLSGAISCVTMATRGELCPGGGVWVPVRRKVQGHKLVLSSLTIYKSVGPVNLEVSFCLHFINPAVWRRCGN